MLYTSKKTSKTAKTSKIFSFLKSKIIGKTYVIDFTNDLNRIVDMFNKEFFFRKVEKIPKYFGDKLSFNKDLKCY